jgi:hypothetical protein
MDSTIASSTQKLEDKTEHRKTRVAFAQISHHDRKNRFGCVVADILRESV